MPMGLSLRGVGRIFHLPMSTRRIGVFVGVVQYYETNVQKTSDDKARDAWCACTRLGQR